MIDEYGIHGLVKTDLRELIGKTLACEIRVLGSIPGFDINCLQETRQLLAVI